LTPCEIYLIKRFHPEGIDSLMEYSDSTGQVVFHWAHGAGYLNLSVRKGGGAGGISPCVPTLGLFLFQKERKFMDHKTERIRA
jgi:hypothetical protein